jgi:hypothetical protein
MAYEAFSWIDATIYLSTGVAFATSAVVGLCENSNVSTQWGYVNTPAADGTYYDHITGQRANVSLQQVYTVDRSLLAIADSATALHLKLMQSGANGSAGMYLWSGRIDNVNYAGQKAGVFMLSCQMHYNNWSAF